MTTEPRRITGLRGKLRKRWICRVFGYDLYLVPGSYIRAQWADFLSGHPLVYKFIPKGEIWIDNTFSGRDWPGYLAAHELIEVLLMAVRKWSYERAHEAANALEQELRSLVSLRSPNPADHTKIWFYHLSLNFPGMDKAELQDMAASVASRLWKFV